MGAVWVQAVGEGGVSGPGLWDKSSGQGQVEGLGPGGLSGMRQVGVRVRAVSWFSAGGEGRAGLSSEAQLRT